MYVPEREQALLSARREQAQELGVSADLAEDVLRRVDRIELPDRPGHQAVGQEAQRHGGEAHHGGDARAEVAEGVRVGEGAVLSMGVYLGASTKIVDRATGKIYMGEVPPYAVVVPGSMPGKPLPDGTMGPSLYCAVIVKTVDAQTRSKTSINDLLRD